MVIPLDAVLRRPARQAARILDISDQLISIAHGPRLPAKPGMLAHAVSDRNPNFPSTERAGKGKKKKVCCVNTRDLL
jgi:hypothetical protein